MFHTTRNIQGATLRRERPEDPTRFGYATPPVDEMLNRTIQKWLQSLKLTINVTSARRDMQNGYVCAQIFNRYYPSEICMELYSNGTSTNTRTDNYAQLQRFLGRTGKPPLPEKLVALAVRGEVGAGVQLLEHLYELLTRKKLLRWGDVTPEMLDCPMHPPEKETATRDVDSKAGKAPPTRERGEFEERPIEAPVQGDVAVLTVGAVATKQIGDAMTVRMQFAESQSRVGSAGGNGDNGRASAGGMRTHAAGSQSQSRVGSAGGQQ